MKTKTGVVVSVDKEGRCAYLNVVGQRTAILGPFDEVRNATPQALDVGEVCSFTLIQDDRKNLPLARDIFIQVNR